MSKIKKDICTKKMGKHLTREEKRRIQRLRANAAGIVAALALVSLGIIIHAGLLRLA